MQVVNLDSTCLPFWGQIAFTFHHQMVGDDFSLWSGWFPRVETISMVLL